MENERPNILVRSCAAGKWTFLFGDSQKVVRRPPTVLKVQIKRIAIIENGKFLAETLQAR